MKKRVAVVVVNYRGLNDTLVCLKSLIECRGKEGLLSVVVNVAETDKDKEEGRIIRRKFPTTQLIETENVGFSGANNRGIKLALGKGAEIIMLLNNDTEVDKDLLVSLEKALRRKEVGVVSPKIYFYPGREFHHDDYTDSERGKVIWYAGGIIDWANVYGYHRGVDEVDHGQFDEGEETDFTTGCCLATRREVLERVGLLNENYFLYWEDADWSMRVKRAGFKVWYEPQGKVWHKNAGTTGGAGSTLHQYYQTRNRLFFGFGYAPIRTKLALVREAGGKLSKGTLVERQAVKDFFLLRKGRGTI
ncbi:hypothetical protein A3A66_00530 [Microgenomates group bacterium RIFCSPLOWO2_01_FULL_46_13]|nr:MAG: hypothetical protein A2783_03805 [Microgenomates group bacterium RIFCSPHIGHO2_01_FULL_45_11]OGV94499.1 MAG: hypothetical protein A3A66_00530 [Microgenomates group bacterium RIFCSPLOWO2_01_FULL_46_13]